MTSHDANFIRYANQSVTRNAISDVFNCVTILFLIN
jgi:hypothetical protein